MSRVLLLGALLLTGCCNVVGPMEHFRTYPRPDNPCLPIYEQEKRGRDQLAMPEMSSQVAPRTYVEFPSPSGR